MFKILQTSFYERLFLCWSQNDILNSAPVAECLDLVCCAFGTHLCFCQKKMPKTKKRTTSCVWWQSGGCFREILSVCSFTLTCSVLTEPSPAVRALCLLSVHCIRAWCAKCVMLLSKNANAMHSVFNPVFTLYRLSLQKKTFPLRAHCLLVSLQNSVAPS